MNVLQLAAYVLNVTRKQVSAVVSRVMKVINVTNAHTGIMDIQNADDVVVTLLALIETFAINLASVNAIKKATVHAR